MTVSTEDLNVKTSLVETIEVVKDLIRVILLTIDVPANVRLRLEKQYAKLVRAKDRL